MNSFEVPVLLIVFNRPNHTKRVFERIREIRPRYLYVAADGPRGHAPEDKFKCEKVRKIVTENIDWDCELRTLFQEQNLGCGLAVSESISWFFEEVEYGIVLEDDCVPSKSFFPFCEFLLKQYANQENIMMVSGFNPLGVWGDRSFDYFFTEGSIWGWASWKRAWRHYDFGLTSYKKIIGNPYFQSLVEKFIPDFNNIYMKLVSREVDTWDYQWYIARLINHGLSITPSVNLIENIGFDAEATHTKWTLNPFRENKTSEMTFPLRVNSVMIKDEMFQKAIAEKENKSPGKLERVFQRLKMR